MPPNEDNLRALRMASGELEDALHADSAWTALVTALDRPTVWSAEGADEYIAGFMALREDIDRAVEAGRRIKRIVELVVGRDDAFRELNPSLVSALESADSGPALDALRHADNSLIILADRGSAAMQESRDEAMGILLSDLQGVLCGTPVQGWLPKRFLCGIARVSMAAGLVTVWVPPHAHAAAAVGLGAAVYKGAGCAERATANPR